jgi:hypothetical protein
MRSVITFLLKDGRHEKQALATLKAVWRGLNIAHRVFQVNIFLLSQVVSLFPEPHALPKLNPARQLYPKEEKKTGTESSDT